MKYVYGARKLNETNADDRSEHDRASTLEFTRYDSYLFHAFPPPFLLSPPPPPPCRYIARQVTTLPTADANPHPSPSNTGRGEWRKWINRDSLTAADRANIV